MVAGKGKRNMGFVWIDQWWQRQPQIEMVRQRAANAGAGIKLRPCEGSCPQQRWIECGARLQESPGQPDPLLQEDQSSRCTCRGSPSAIMYALMVDQTIGSTRVVRGNASLSGVRRCTSELNRAGQGSHLIIQST